MCVYSQNLEKVPALLFQHMSLVAHTYTNTPHPTPAPRILPRWVLPKHHTRSTLCCSSCFRVHQWLEPQEGLGCNAVILALECCGVQELVDVLGWQQILYRENIVCASCVHSVHVPQLYCTMCIQCTCTAIAFYSTHIQCSALPAVLLVQPHQSAQPAGLPAPSAASVHQGPHASTC